MKNAILHELKRHAPFTIVGALVGILIAVLLRNISYKAAYDVFYVLHPLHVVLSALVTASMYRNYKCPVEKRRCSIPAILAVGYLGSIGIATISDSVIPYIGEVMLKMERADAHIGFIEEWPKVTVLAGLGILIAYFYPTTKFPHAGHVLVSTGASLFHIIMAAAGAVSILSYIAIFAFLFVAVWVPCCVSDIVFPLLFIGKEDLAKRGGSQHSH